MSAEHRTQFTSKKTKRKRPKLPFLSLATLHEWSRTPFTESIGFILAELQALTDSQYQTVDLDPLADLASLFNTLQRPNLPSELDKVAEEMSNEPSKRDK